MLPDITLQIVRTFLNQNSPTPEERAQVEQFKALIKSTLASLDPSVNCRNVNLAGSRAKNTALRGADADFVVDVGNTSAIITRNLRNKVATALQVRGLQGREIKFK
ncbi:hypothetical protein BDK51DRAFT_32433 [Blyttiomyces helicus]|uniref:Polymerase nucleotidyl transferase domain-containing protein n=1 Tax=Blyttiomyces helicus TaxID=388810 RepID=A0A4P9W1W6_9FUNG|nr:hypothetical protein BDK51DRAFT_32433 [Blyttiomyces helicus]|eukprot:RKO85355.1 hypothetical protein BDK51DRAFT_32433 [Blyttiomyces helicus]